MNVPYRPSQGVIGDCVPFYWRGQYHLFYLRGFESAFVSSDARWLGSGWYHLVSDDLINWRELPMAFGPGPVGSRDFSCCATGSIVERNGTFHAFYPGFNMESVPFSAVCHARSSDLIHWEKDPASSILSADPRWYDPTIGFGDSFCFWNEEAGEYWMLLTSFLASGPRQQRGCLALATSPDLAQWETHPPFWSPGLELLEVVRLFRLGSRWYLTFNQRTNGRMAVMVRSADTLRGPWRAQDDGQLDSAHWYAGTTLTTKERCYALGWVPTLAGNQPDGAWEWGGHMSTPRELLPAADGRLCVRCPPVVLEQFRSGREEALSALSKACRGDWTVDAHGAECTVPDSLGYVLLPPLSSPGLLEAQVTLGPSTQRAGFLLRTKPDLSRGYALLLEPAHNRVVVEHWPRPNHQPPALSRVFSFTPGETIHCRILLSGTVMEAFVDDQIVLSTRLYAAETLPCGLIVQEGTARFLALAQKHAAVDPTSP
jgi:beta-fructofuranosidase